MRAATFYPSHCCLKFILASRKAGKFISCMIITVISSSLSHYKLHFYIILPNGLKYFAISYGIMQHCLGLCKTAWIGNLVLTKSSLICSRSLWLICIAIKNYSCLCSLWKIVCSPIFFSIRICQEHIVETNQMIISEN